MLATSETASGPAGHEGLRPPGVRHRHRPGGAGLFAGRGARAGPRPGLHLRPRHHARDPGRLRPQPPRDGHRAITAPASRPISSRSRRASTGPACASTSTATSRASISSARTRSCCKDGKQITEFRDGILPWALQNNIALVLRRVRRRPPGRDVRDPARARGLGPADAARPEPRHPPAPRLPAVRDRQHGRPRRHLGPLSRHAADQPGPDGPLVDRDDAELPAARQGGRHRPGQGEALPRRRKGATSSTTWCASPTSPATPSSTATSRP